MLTSAQIADAVRAAIPAAATSLRPDALTALEAPFHIAALPDAVNMGCSAIRSASVEVGA